MPRKKSLQKTTQNNVGTLIQVKNGIPDTISNWIEAYFRFEVTTSEASRKEQRRDLIRFRDFLLGECGREDRQLCTARLSRAFKDFLRKGDPDKGQRRNSDRTVNRIMAHLETFAKWIHKLKPFPLDNPMAKIKLLPLGTGLEVDRALTPSERRRMLDTADSLPLLGGRSCDRHRYRGQERPQRKGYRPYRNRAIVYYLIETGMRRAAVRSLDLKAVTVKEKGGRQHTYKITGEALNTIQDYLDIEIKEDFAKWKSSALFLSAANTAHGNGRLNPRLINTVWNQVCDLAGVEGRTPHSARHGVGTHLIAKIGNIAAVRRQLGHTNPAYSMQYARITDEELGDVLEDR